MIKGAKKTSSKGDKDKDKDKQEKQDKKEDRVNRDEFFAILNKTSF